MSFTKVLANGAEFLLTNGRRAILESPKFNLAMAGRLKEKFEQFTAEYAQHNLHMFVGYKPTLEKAGLWGKFIGTKENPGFRSANWKNSPFFLALDNDPTVHVLFSQFRQTARGTVVTPVATSRVMHVSGEVRKLVSNGTNLNLITPEFPSLRLQETVQLNKDAWMNVFHKIQVQNPNGILSDLGHSSEVSGVFIDPSVRSLGLAKYVSGMPKAVQVELNSNYVSEVTSMNWGPAANSGKEYFGNGAINPRYFDYDEATKQVVTMVMGDEATVAKVLARPNEPWVPLDTFLAHYKHYRDHAIANKPFDKFDWSTGTSLAALAGVVYMGGKSLVSGEQPIEYAQAS